MERLLCNSLEEILRTTSPHPKIYILELNVTRDDALAAIREGRFSDVIIRAEQLLAVTSNKYTPQNIKFTPSKAPTIIAPAVDSDSTIAPGSPSEQTKSDQSTTTILSVTATIKSYLCGRA